MSRSADLSLHVLSVHKQLLPRPELDKLLQRAEREGRAFESLLRELHPGPELEKLLAMRSRHGRRCGACGETTFLLPRQTEANTRCELCQGPLLSPSDPAAAGPRPSGRLLRPSTSGRLKRPAPASAGPCPVCEQALEAQGWVACRACQVQHHAACWKQTGRCARCGEEMFLNERAAARMRPSAAATPAATPAADELPGASPAADESPGAAPAAEPSAPAPEPAAAAPERVGADRPLEAPPLSRDERAKQLRRGGGGFGYEPQPVEAAPARGRLGTTPIAATAPVEAIPDDGRFGPPAAHLAQAHAEREQAPPPPPARPLREELGLVLTYPLRGPEGPALLALGAFFFAFLKVLPMWGVFLVGTLLTYPTAYLVKIAEEAMRGRTELPTWPEFDPLELLGLAIRMFLALLAGMLPCVVVCLLLLRGPKLPDGFQTIGPDAHLSAGKTPDIPPATSAADATFLQVDGTSEVKLGGKWTILGLLERDLADDTGMSRMMQDLPRGGFGVLINDGFQIYDLERVGRALGGRGQVRVLAAYADPANKVLRYRWPHLFPPDEPAAASPGWEPDEGDETDEGEPGDEAFPSRPEVKETLDRAMATAQRGTAITAGTAPREGGPRPDPGFQVVEFVKSSEMVFPAPFQQLKRFPCVYVIDPQGRVAREYSTGVCDRKLYADMLDLMGGGRGDTWPKDLPPAALGLAGGVPGIGGWLAATALYLAGLFYTPMALLLTVVFTSGVLAFNYPAGFRAIQASLPDYLSLYLLLVGVSVLVVVGQAGAELLLRRLMPATIGGAASWFVMAAIAFYGLSVQAFGIGRYYYANQARIGWFSR